MRAYVCVRGSGRIGVYRGARGTASPIRDGVKVTGEAHRCSLDTRSCVTITSVTHEHASPFKRYSRSRSLGQFVSPYPRFSGSAAIHDFVPCNAEASEKWRALSGNACRARARLFIWRVNESSRAYSCAPAENERHRLMKRARIHFAALKLLFTVDLSSRTFDDSAAFTPWHSRWSSHFIDTCN